MDLKALAAEFPKEAVHWRVQGKPYQGNNGWAAKALAYIDARDVMDRLDEVCGPQAWQAEYIETASGRVICRIGINTLAGKGITKEGAFVPFESWVWKSDGAGSTQVEGEKGGISDALKRAGVAWGIGRYLYRLDSPWVPCTVKQKGGNTYWDAWSVDPWTRVKVVGYQKPDETSSEEKNDRDPVKIANSLVGLIHKCATPKQLNETIGGQKFDAAWQWLAEEHEAESQRVRAALDEHRANLEAEQAAA